MEKKNSNDITYTERIASDRDKNLKETDVVFNAQVHAEVRKAEFIKEIYHMKDKDVESKFCEVRFLDDEDNTFTLKDKQCFDKDKYQRGHTGTLKIQVVLPATGSKKRASVGIIDFIED